jgi:hypothetical protein
MGDDVRDDERMGVFSVLDLFLSRTDSLRLCPRQGCCGGSRRGFHW